MGYCFMNTDKIKTAGQLMVKYNHNFRQVTVENADPSLAFLNEELVRLPLDENEERMNYRQVWRERIKSLPYYQDHKVYSNAVHAIEVLTTFSREDGDNIDIEEWKKKNVEWLQKTFNVAGDGKDNVISVVYHADEPGNVHCHAIVIPIDERGHLNASRFLNGKRAMSEHQTDYAEAMKEFGLKRGLENSQATHKDIRRFYAELNQAIEDIPEPIRGETAQEYKDRAVEQIKTANAAALRKEKLAERQKIEGITKSFNDHREQWISIAKEKVKLEKEVSSLKMKKVEIEDEIGSEELSRFRAFRENYGRYKKEHPDRAERFEKEVEFIERYENVREEDHFR